LADGPKSSRESIEGLHMTEPSEASLRIHALIEGTIEELVEIGFANKHEALKLLLIQAAIRLPEGIAHKTFAQAMHANPTTSPPEIH
jgi:hypothetical protein